LIAVKKKLESEKYNSIENNATSKYNYAKSLKKINHKIFLKDKDKDKDKDELAKLELMRDIHKTNEFDLLLQDVKNKYSCV